MARTHVEVRISPYLEPSEKDCIAAFQRRCKGIQDTRVLKETGRIRARLNWSVGNPFVGRFMLPAEEDLRSFYMAFRFFYMEREKSNFLRVANIVSRRAQNGLVDRHIKALKEQWHGVLERKGWNIKLNGQELTAKLLIDLWFNAHYFHGDDKKQKELDDLNTILSTEFNKYLLADAVFTGTKSVLKLYEALKDLRL